MLGTDIEWLTIADLRAEDKVLVDDIAGANEIDLSNCIARAIDDVGVRLLSDLIQMESYPTDSVSFIHLRALGMVGQASRLQLQQVVIDAQDGQAMSPLKTWALHEAILRAYRKCINNAVDTVDKYLSRVKFEEREIQNKLYPRVYNGGVAVVRAPLSRPGATRDWWPVGCWPATPVTTTAGSGSAGTYDVAVTWVDQSNGTASYVSWSKTGNCESAPSDIITVDATANTDLVVDISCFAPPAGIVPVEVLGTVFPRKATGWNIYCAISGNPLRLQNSTPFALPAPAAGLTQPAFLSITPQRFTPIVGYASMGNGQRRDMNLAPIERSGRI